MFALDFGDVEVGLGGGGPLQGLFGSALVLDLDSRAGITTVSGAVSEWDDQSGASGNRNVSQSNAGGRPAFSSNGGVNGLPKLTFSGSHSLPNTVTNLIASGGDRTIYAVASYSGVASFPTIICFRTGNPALSFMVTTVANGQFTFTDGAGNAFLASAWPTGAGLHLFTAKIYKTSANFDTAEAYLDAVARTVSGPSPAAMSADSGATGFNIGTNPSGQGFSGDLYRIVVVGRKTTAAEDTTVGALFHAIYGVP